MTGAQSSERMSALKGVAVTKPQVIRGIQKLRDKIVESVMTMNIDLPNDGV